MDQQESKIQSDIVRHYNNTYCLAHQKPRCIIFSIPNGGERDVIKVMLSRAMGEYKGASDLVIIHKGKLIFVEVKTPTGVQSKDQKMFEQHVRECGFDYFLVRSLEEFLLIITTVDGQINK
jgi:hypothetical protein